MTNTDTDTKEFTVSQLNPDDHIVGCIYHLIKTVLMFPDLFSRNDNGYLLHISMRCMTSKLLPNANELKPLKLTPLIKAFWDNADTGARQNGKNLLRIATKELKCELNDRNHMNYWCIEFID